MTADHSHVFTIGGYPKRGNPVFGLVRKVGNEAAVDTENKTYTTLGYMNGPGGLNGSRPDLRNVDTADKGYLQQATVLLKSETHSSEDVGKNVDYLKHFNTLTPITTCIFSSLFLIHLSHYWLRHFIISVHFLILMSCMFDQAVICKEKLDSDRL